MKHKPLLYILAIALIVKLTLLFNYTTVWWDEAVYVGMAKFIYSGGTQGLWEPIRPVVWPLIIGLFKWTNILVAARALEFLCYIGIITFTYLIANKVFDKKTALLSSIMIAATPTLFFFSYKSLTNVPATFFVLASVYLFLYKKYLISGILLSIAFLTRFPTGAFIVVLGGFLLFDVYKKKVKITELVMFSSAFAVPVIIYLIANQIMYGNILFPFIQASSVISSAAIWTYEYKIGFYLSGLLKENVFYFLAIIYFFMMVQIKPRKEKLMIFLLPIPIFIYFSFLIHQEMRFIMSSIPFIAILAMALLSELLKKKVVLTVFIILILIHPAFTLYHYSEREQDLSLFESIDADLLFTTQPIAAVSTDAKIMLMYYPIFNKERATSLIEELKIDEGITKSVYLDYCEFDAFCNPDDKLCEEGKIEIIEFLKENYQLTYSNNETCKKEIFTSA